MGLAASTNDGPELAREIRRLTARHDMSDVHTQILAELVSPRALLAMSQRVFNTYCDTGRLEIVHSERGYFRARCGNCVGWHHNMWMELAGSCARRASRPGLSSRTLLSRCRALARDRPLIVTRCGD